MTVVPPESACYRCLFEEPPAPGEVLGCQQAGILGAVAGTIGSIQATEAVKYIVGLEEHLLMNRLLTYDAKTMEIRNVPVPPNPRCKACGAGAPASQRSHA